MSLAIIIFLAQVALVAYWYATAPDESELWP